MPVLSPITVWPVEEKKRKLVEVEDPPSTTDNGSRKIKFGLDKSSARAVAPSAKRHTQQIIARIHSIRFNKEDYWLASVSGVVSVLGGGSGAGADSGATGAGLPMLMGATSTILFATGSYKIALRAEA